VGVNDSRTELHTQSEAARRQLQDARSPVVRIGRPGHQSPLFKKLDVMVGTDCIDAHPFGEAALVEAGLILYRSDDAILQRREILRPGNFGKRAQANLVKQPREVRRNAVYDRNL
jgi:hypothetical protein